MNDPVHLETLAALLDGALSDEDRTRVLARLVRSEHEYEDVLEAAALLDEMNAEASVEATSPPVALVREDPASLISPAR